MLHQDSDIHFPIRRDASFNGAKRRKLHHHGGNATGELAHHGIDDAVHEKDANKNESEPQPGAGVARDVCDTHKPGLTAEQPIIQLDPNLDNMIKSTVDELLKEQLPPATTAQQEQEESPGTQLTQQEHVEEGTTWISSMRASEPASARTSKKKDHRKKASLDWDPPKDILPPADSDSPLDKLLHLKYCTQKCLLGLKEMGALDSRCPNVSYHRQGRETGTHIINKGTFQSLLNAQLAFSSTNYGCTPFSLGEAPGKLFAHDKNVIFRITLISHGYTLLGKGTGWQKLDK